MDANFVVDLIKNVGVPVATMIFAFWYINKETEAHRKERQELEQAHKEEVEKITETNATTVNGLRDVIQNNTLVMQRFLDKMDK